MRARIMRGVRAPAACVPIQGGVLTSDASWKTSSERCSRLGALLPLRNMALHPLHAPGAGGALSTSWALSMSRLSTDAHARCCQAVIWSCRLRAKGAIQAEQHSGRWCPNTYEVAAVRCGRGAQGRHATRAAIGTAWHCTTCRQPQARSSAASLCTTWQQADARRRLSVLLQASQGEECCKHLPSGRRVKSKRGIAFKFALHCI